MLHNKLRLCFGVLHVFRCLRAHMQTYRIAATESSLKQSWSSMMRSFKSGLKPGSSKLSDPG